MNETDTILLAAGAVAALVALVAWVAEHRRTHRSDMDRVGCMPWTTVFFLAMMAAVLLLGLGGRDWLAG